MSRRTSLVLAAASALGATAVIAAPAASASADVEKRGTCSAGARWEAEAEHDDGGIDVKLEVKSNRVGQSWRGTVSQDGARVHASTRTTVRDDDDDNSYRAKAEWELRRPNTGGSDRFVLRAVNQSTGEVCRAVLTL